MTENNYGIFWSFEDWWMPRDYDKYIETSEQATQMFGQKTSPEHLRWFIQFAKREYCREGEYREVDARSEVIKPKPKIHSGVYILYDKNEMVYIGQSKHIEYRIAEHAVITDKHHGKIEFDSYSIFKIDGSKEDREAVEVVLIKMCKPKYNKAVKKDVKIEVIGI
ncbi:GIY-YIG nuclease family protein [candidate division WOR-3 bacterium]|nr:GIY-YIG nuclease family protein [candidate division WOR-3 bacterium]